MSLSMTSRTPQPAPASLVYGSEALPRFSRRELLHLHSLPDYLLRDIGIERADLR
jgi:uncharacterized protein YjiS (DUF1127 family)